MPAPVPDGAARSRSWPSARADGSCSARGRRLSLMHRLRRCRARLGWCLRRPTDRFRKSIACPAGIRSAPVAWPRQDFGVALIIRRSRCAQSFDYSVRALPAASWLLAFGLVACAAARPHVPPVSEQPEPGRRRVGPAVGWRGWSFECGSAGTASGGTAGASAGVQLARSARTAIRPRARIR